MEPTQQLDLFAKARQLKEGELEELLTTTLDALFLTGAARVKLSGRTDAFQHAMSEAISRATTEPGCEAQFTCKVLDEAVFAFSVMYETLKTMGKLDEERTQLHQIELTNGSCIAMKLEKKA